MKILVTGATGFIGSYLCRALLEQNHEVFALSHYGKNERIASLLSHKRLHLLSGDLRSLPTMKKVMEADKIDAIVHLGHSKTHPQQASDNPEFLETNIKGTLNVLQSSLSANVPRVIFSSTKDVYGVPRYLPVDESHPTNPLNFYTLTKMQGENHLEFYAQNYGISVIVLRYACVYGFGKNRGAVYNFIQAALKGQPFQISSDGNQTRDFVYVGDVVNATMKALDIGGEVRFDIFNIGSGRETFVNELATEVIGITGANINFRYVPENSEDRFVFDIGKAQRVLGYQPRPLEDGLAEFIEFLKSGG